MRFPSPSYRAYVEFVATVLTTFAVLQYTGIFSEGVGGINPMYLVSLGLLLPISLYLLTVVQENVEWLPQWERMVQNKE